MTGSVMQNFIMVSSAMPKLKKQTNDPIARKTPGQTEIQTKRQKDGLTLL